MHFISVFIVCLSACLTYVEDVFVFMLKKHGHSDNDTIIITQQTHLSWYRNIRYQYKVLIYLFQTSYRLYFPSRWSDGSSFLV